jgi:hypothetical protein
MADAAYATRRNGRTRTAIEDGITGTTENTPQRRHAQSLDKDSLQLPQPALAGDQERSLLLLPKEHRHPGPSRSCAIAQSTGIWQDRTESTWFFTYWEAGDNDPPPPRGLKQRPLTDTCGQYHGLSHEPAPPRLKSFREFREVGRLAAH